jgi:CheY-like chemotaxis protein
LVEDYKSLQISLSLLLRSHFGPETIVHVCGTIIEVEVTVSVHRDIDLILMDTSLGNGVTTFFLTEKIRKEHGFTGPIIATSGNDDNHPEMLRRGCSHACLKEKIGDFLIEHFTLVR